MPIITIASLLLFLGFIAIHQHDTRIIEMEKVEEHAQIVSAALWSFERETPVSYLALALKANQYRSITVKDEMGLDFIHLKAAPLTGIDAFFLSIGLIQNINFQAPVSFEKREIGTIDVLWTCKTIYYYFYILFCLLLFLLGCSLYLKVLDAQNNLKERVKERTKDLELEIENHQKTSTQLALQAQRLSLHVQYTPLGVVEWSPHATIQNWNKAAETIFGFSKDEVLGRHPFDFLIPKNEQTRATAHWEKLWQDKKAGRIICSSRTKNGSIKTCCWYNTTLRDSNDTIIGLASLVLDMTDQVEAEKKNKVLQKQLIQAQKMEAIGNLAGGIAHDFNNILQSITGYTQLLLLTGNWDTEQHKKLQGIEETAKRAADLVKKLLTFSRKMESNLVPLDLNRELHHIIGILQHTLPKMIHIEMSLSSRISTIKGDKVQIEQVLLNLAINASHAMAQGGTLTIATQDIELDSDFCANNIGAKAGKNVMLQVTDTGTGMDKNTLEKIFEPFFTTKESGRGTGLGLSTVYGIVVEHGAHIQCTSKLGSGTTFTLYFPAIGEQVDPHSSANNDKAPLPQGKETILLVDDEASLLTIGKQILRSFGYTPILTQSGEDAIQIYSKSKETIDLIAIDLSMPGMGGLRCIEKIREQDCTIPILVISGFIPYKTRKHLIQLGIINTITKPYTLESLSMGIRKALDTAKNSTLKN